MLSHHLFRGFKRGVGKNVQIEVKEFAAFENKSPNSKSNHDSPQFILLTYKSFIGIAWKT
jgi:hypothetical protein